MHIAGKMQVDIFHGQHLGIAAPRRAAFDAEYRPQGRLPQGDHGLFPNLRHSLSQTGGGGGLSLACGRGVDGGDQNQFAIRPVPQPLKGFRVDLRFVLAIEFQLVLQKPQLGPHFPDGLERGALGDLNIGHHVASTPFLFFIMGCVHYKLSFQNSKARIKKTC